MTQRKPPGMKTQDWVEAQIQQAQKAGEFDDLAGAGKPLKLPDGHDPDWWVKDYLRREQLDVEALLPAAVQLRKEKQQVHEKVARMRRESEVRDYLADLNQRILVSIRDTTGPVVPVGTVDEEEILEHWRTHRPEPTRVHEAKPADEPRKKSVWQRLFS
ncbi:DUF1992 domain-containing protein [Kribbella turkmenica]|uniref:DUF1992 domain-containing protein n=1 Tax=Kribbella turkmenica TaxID=2530375 RepID=A0A4R4X4E9_9ACTN|nr:DUF1992 domain-containing protein [Kribbella turkmenica]TDD25173.1 DUF1992 domain-containing protein [Kribbella turkmenica]